MKSRSSAPAPILHPCTYGGGVYNVVISDPHPGKCYIAECWKRPEAIPVVKIHGDSCNCIATIHVRTPVCGDHVEWKDPFNRDTWSEIFQRAARNGVHMALPIRLVEVSYEFIM